MAVLSHSPLQLAEVLLEECGVRIGAPHTLLANFNCC